MTTLLEAAQAVVNASKEYTPTWIHWAIKNRINALEQAIAQEHSKPIRSCGTCVYFEKGKGCSTCDDKFCNWEPKP